MLVGFRRRRPHAISQRSCERPRLVIGWQAHARDDADAARWLRIRTLSRAPPPKADASAASKRPSSLPSPQRIARDRAATSRPARQRSQRNRCASRELTCQAAPSSLLDSQSAVPQLEHLRIPQSAAGNVQGGKQGSARHRFTANTNDEVAIPHRLHRSSACLHALTDDDL